MSSAAVTTSVCATRQATVPSASSANVSISDWTMTWARRGDPSSGHDRRRRAVRPAQRRPTRRRARRCGSRRPRRAGRSCPSSWPAARRRSSRRSGADHAPRGPSSRSSARHSASGSAETLRPEIDQRAAGLPQGEDASRLPLPAQRQRARRPPGYVIVALRGSAARGGGVTRRRMPVDPSAALGRIRGVPAVLGDGRHRGVRPGSAAFPAGPGRRRSAGRPPPRPRVAPEVGIHDHAQRRVSNPIGGMPPMTKPVRSCASRAVDRRISGSPVTAARRARSTRLWPDTRHTIGSRPPSSRRDEDERLHDLTELRRRRLQRPPRPCASTRRRR